MRTLPWLGAALALAASFAGVRDAGAAPHIPEAQALRETAVRMVAARGDRVKKPAFVRNERKLLYSLGKVPLATELTGSQAVAVLLQAQMEVEVLRTYARADVLLELWWKNTIADADAAIAGGLQAIAVPGLTPERARARANNVREQVRGEILLRPLNRLLASLDRDDPGETPYQLVEAQSAFVAFIVPVRLVVSPPNSTVRYCSEWDWELWTLLGEDPRTKMSSASTAEPVRLDGSYYFEILAPGALAPVLVGPRGVDPSTGTVTLP